MTSNSQETLNSLQPVSSPGLKPHLTGAVSRPPRSRDSSISPEEHGWTDGTHSRSYGDEEEDRDEFDRIPDDKRPWYRKPSPWWMLTLMPISAMTLAGVNPSLYEVYTDLVCRSIHGPAPSTLAFEAGHNLPLNRAGVLPGFLSVSPVEEHGHAHTTAGRSDDYVWIPRAETEQEGDGCADAVVQAAVSKLLSALLTTQGILSCITAASWASLSDRLGRRPILTLTSSAIIVCYSIFIGVYYFADHLPGGYWMLLFGPIIYGLLGGSAGTTAATNAYIADCTPETERAKTFSLTLGLRFTGMAIGPALNSLLVKVTGTPIAALILVIGTHVVYVLMMLFVVPESLSTEKRMENRRAWREAREAAASRDVDSNTHGFLDKVVQLSLSLGRSVLAFVRPLSAAGPILVTHPSGRTHKDWSLTFITISAGLASIILASYTSMFQYAVYMFGWSAVELGYWYSGIVAARALTLTIILPVIIKIYHWFTNESHVATTPSSSSHTDARSSDVTPLLSEDREDAATSQTESRAETKAQARKTPAFDLAIAQASLALEVVCYALVPVLFSHDPMLFIILTILASCGAGFGPAIQALAVDLYARRGGTEMGRLFGVLSVVQTISSQILGPTIYGLTYMKLVAFYPQGIFFVSVAAVASAVTFLLFVELPGKNGATVSRDVESNA